MKVKEELFLKLNIKNSPSLNMIKTQEKIKKKITNILKIENLIAIFNYIVNKLMIYDNNIIYRTLKWRKNQS